jgi:hypothetical protein
MENDNAEARGRAAEARRNKHLCKKFLTFNHAAVGAASNSS